MSKATRALWDAAKNLCPNERLELVDQILESLNESDPALDALWAKELEDRLVAFRRGDLRAIPLAEVLAKYARE